MGALALGHFIIWLGLHGMDKIREFDGILDKENRSIVAYKVKIALAGIKFCRKAAYIPHCVGGP